MHRACACPIFSIAVTAQGLDTHPDQSNCTVASIDKPGGYIVSIDAVSACLAGLKEAEAKGDGQQDPRDPLLNEF